MFTGMSMLSIFEILFWVGRALLGTRSPKKDVNHAKSTIHGKKRRHGSILMEAQQPGEKGRPIKIWKHFIVKKNGNVA